MPVTSAAIEFGEMQLRTGVRLRYADMGPRDGPPMLLLHGYSDSWFSFSRVIGLLPADMRLIIPDQRGHGDSDRPLAGYTLGNFAEDAVALMEGLGLPPAVVVGHSLGGFIVQRLAAIAPQRVKRLVIMGAAANPRNRAVLDLMNAVKELTDPVDIEFVREFQTSTIFRPVPPAFLDRIISESLRLPARVWQSALSGLLESQPLDPGIIQCPTSIFWGDRDAIFDRDDQADLLDRIPGAKLYVFEGAGHDPQWELPEEFSRVLIASLTR